MKLVELARTVRSKNAGPLKLTLDLLFDDEAACNPPRLSPAPMRAFMCERRERSRCCLILAGLAIKIVMDRMRGPTRNLPVPTHAF